MCCRKKAAWVLQKHAENVCKFLLDTKRNEEMNEELPPVAEKIA